MQVITVEFLKNSIEKDIEYNKGLYIFHSTMFIILGITAMIMPMASVRLLSIFLGLIIFMSGVVQIASTTETRHNKFTLISAITSIVVGVLMMINPIAGVLTFSIVTATFLMFQGIIIIAMSLEISLLRRWWILFISGITTVILSVMLFSVTPYKDIIYMGIMVGISMLLYGISILLITIQSENKEDETPDLIETTPVSKEIEKLRGYNDISGDSD